jgi:hypothetical protein
MILHGGDQWEGTGAGGEFPRLSSGAPSEKDLGGDLTGAGGGKE